VFAIFAAFYYWYPLFYGFSFNEKLRKVQFWIIFVGVNLTFFPQHFLGLAGIPRRVSDYNNVFNFWNWISSVGRIITILGLILFIVLIWESFSHCKAILLSLTSTTHLEWQYRQYPLDIHTGTESLYLCE